MAKRNDKREEFLDDVLTTAVEGGVQYWCMVRQGEGDAYLLIDHEDGQRHKVNIETIARGWGLYKGESISGQDYGKQAMLANQTNGEDGDYDADVADIVLQLGLFGKVVYG